MTPSQFRAFSSFLLHSIAILETYFFNFVWKRWFCTKKQIGGIGVYKGQLRQWCRHFLWGRGSWQDSNRSLFSLPLSWVSLRQLQMIRDTFSQTCVSHCLFTWCIACTFTSAQLLNSPKQVQWVCEWRNVIGEGRERRGSVWYLRHENHWKCKP